MLTQEVFRNIKDQFEGDNSKIIEELKAKCSDGVEHKIRSSAYKLILIGCETFCVNYIEDINLDRYFKGIDVIRAAHPSNITSETQMTDIKKPGFLDLYFSAYYFSDVLKEPERSSDESSAFSSSYTDSSIPYMDDEVKSIYTSGSIIPSSQIASYNIKNDICTPSISDNKTLKTQLDQIDKDIIRLPEEFLTMRGQKVEHIYHNILKIYCYLNKDSDGVYTQSNDDLLAGLLSLFMEQEFEPSSDASKTNESLKKIESTTFYCFTILMNYLEIENVTAWKNSANKVSNILESADPELFKHLRDQDIVINGLASK